MFEQLGPENVEQLRDYERAMVAGIHSISIVRASDPLAYTEELVTLRVMLAAVRYHISLRSIRARAEAQPHAAP